VTKLPWGVKEHAGRWARVLLVVVAWAAGPGLAAAQHVGAPHEGGHGGHGAAAALSLFGSVTGVVTRVAPAVGGRTLTEGYVTQPVVGVALSAGAWRLHGMANLEGLTLERGELTPGIWGEGYVDRRHPHTYLHELMVGGTAELRGGVGMSLTAGRGFVPFGTDDPMVRPFVKYPSNHHLAQLLERWAAVGAVRWRALLVEASLLNGDEPERPTDLGGLSRLGDSWSARVTVAVETGVEAQVSRAVLASPEFRGGGGLDHHKWSASARAEHAWPIWRGYALVEWAQTEERHAGGRAHAFTTVLAEAAAWRRDWQAALRLERTQRPEEERTFDAFRTPRPHVGPLMGETQWLSASARAAYSLRQGRLQATPFVELSRSRVSDTSRSAFLPAEHYGSSVLWSVSAGMRLDAGSPHLRMGRYGVAALHSMETRH
jgi:hypothetical protein